jgi:hypothetical protein
MKKQSNNVKLVISLFHYYCGRLKYPKPVETGKDNRIDTHLMIEVTDHKVRLVYNSYKLRRKPDYILYCDVFHEIGHLFQKMPYSTRKQKILAERDAERFALAKLKEFRPKKYKQICKHLKEKKTLERLRKKDKLYYEAFKVIDEYKL